jgi:hypothetical protein
MTAAEADVLPYVEVPTVEWETSECVAERIDDAVPARTLHAAGPDVDLRIQLRVVDRRIGPASPVVVGVEIQDHKAFVVRGDGITHVCEVSIEGVVEGE